MGPLAWAPLASEPLLATPQPPLERNPRYVPGITTVKCNRIRERHTLIQ